MTQNPSNNEDLQATIAGLKDALEKAEIKVVMHEAVWKTSQKLLTERNDEINSLEKQLALYKQEFSDASNAHLDLLNILYAIKADMKDTLDSIEKMENK